MAFQNTDAIRVIKGGGIAGGANTGNNYITFVPGTAISASTGKSADLNKSYQSGKEQVKENITEAVTSVTSKTEQLADALLNGFSFIGKGFSMFLEHWKLVVLAAAAFFFIARK